jgi:hypothetical protein
VFFVNDPAAVHFTYQRYLENSLRERYPFRGTPVRMRFRPRNPDAEERPSPKIKGAKGGKGSKPAKPTGPVKPTGPAKLGGITSVRKKVEARPKPAR